MTNSNDQFSARETVDKILTELNEGTLHVTIDQPIDNALNSFPDDWQHPRSIEEIHRLIGRLVVHVYRHGRTPSHMLSLDEGIDEAIHLLGLEHANPDDGYQAAILDANTRDGMARILSSIVDRIRLVERKKHYFRVTQMFLTRCNWRQRVDIASELLGRRPSLYEKSGVNRSPSEYANALESLFQSELAFQGASPHGTVTGFEFD